jgi:tetratricopeptide (TPR) repeat protein
MKGLFTYALLLVACLAFAQEKDRNLPKGNSAFMDNKYSQAETDYRIAGSKAPTRAAASYNLGNSIYRQSSPGEAKYAYMKAIENAKTRQQKHMAYHNLGNSFMHEKNYTAAVESYKNALRNNPQDEETRYNFALAKKMLKDNPPPKPKNDKKNDKEDKDKNKEQDKKQQPKDDPKDKGGKDDQDKEGKEDDKKDKGKNEPKDKGEDGKDKEDKGGQGNQPQQGQASPSKQRIENLLDAMNNEEKKIQDKINAAKAKGRPVKQEKDW